MTELAAHDAAAAQETAAFPQYARFSRRLRGLFIDWILALCLFMGSLLVAGIVDSDDFSRLLGFMLVISLLLYEPILVSVAGGTIGHYRTNLRVVDDRHGGNVSFLKAVARFVIKALLGWFSFIFMMATRRNQALHDQLTRSTVQIRDPSKAQSNHYIAERIELGSPNLPSRARRTVVIVMYLLLVFVMFVLVSGTGFLVGIVSEQCTFQDRCSYGEHLLNTALTLIWLAASAGVIGFGWQGKLAGARASTEAAN